MSNSGEQGPTHGPRLGSLARLDHAFTGSSDLRQLPAQLPGLLLRTTAAVPGGAFLATQLLGPRWTRPLPVVSGARSKRRVPDGLLRSWIYPLRRVTMLIPGRVR